MLQSGFFLFLHLEIGISHNARRAVDKYRLPNAKKYFGKLVFVALYATKHYSLPIPQNPFLLILVKNEIGAVSESMGPLLS